MSVRCVVVPPGEGAREMTVAGELADYQDLVGGYIATLPYPGGLVCVYNDEGLLDDLPRNRRVPETGALTVDGYLRGPLVFVRSDRAGEFVSLDDDDVARLLWRFRDPTDDPVRPIVRWA